MNASLCVDITAFLILSLTLLYFGSKRKASLPVFRIYYVLVITVMLMTGLDILALFYQEDPSLAPGGVVAVVNMLNLSMQYVIVPLYALYVVANASLDETRYRRWRRAIAFTYLPFLIFVIVMTLLMHFTADPGSMEIYDKIARSVMLLCLGLYFLICCLVGIFYRKTLGRRHTVHLTGAAVFLLCVQGYQIFVLERRVIALMMALGLVDLIFSVQRPEEIFDETDALRRKYFRANVQLDYEYGHSFFVIFIKIHDYRMLVDSLGQEDADGFLKGVTSYLMNIRSNAQVFRLHRDVMVLRIGKSKETDRQRILEEVRARFREPWRNGILTSMLSVSFVAAYCPLDVPTFDDFRRLIVKFSKQEMDSDVLIPVEKLLEEDKEIQMLTAIRRALDTNGFEVYYQPIFSTKENKVVAAEALIRLFDPEFGFIPPEPMIALAEREGYILRIGEIVFTEVCRFYSENKLDQLGIEYIEVNLSAVQCMQNKLAEEFLAIMRTFNLPSNAINFEITETAAMISNAAVTRNISHFELHGVSLSLDDYGTGYSNISYLYNLPFMLMKIDKSLLWAADTNPKADITLCNTFRMAQKLHLKVVMEGVETEEQIRKLLGLHCDYFQGYYFSKPVKGEQFIEYLKNFTLPEVIATWTA